MWKSAVNTEIEVNFGTDKRLLNIDFNVVNITKMLGYQRG